MKHLLSTLVPGDRVRIGIADTERGEMWFAEIAGSRLDAARMQLTANGMTINEAKAITALIEN
jgi:hypothetical protein